jgi:rubrerythrin
MSEKTERNLALALAAESRASARDAAFAQKADHEANPLLARLFRALAESESVHARRVLLLLRGKIGGSRENLESALLRNQLAAEQEYSTMIREAEEEEMKTALMVFFQSREVEPLQAALLEKALTGNLTAPDEDYYVCQVCGFISESRAPENCPVCGAIPGKFKRVV